MKEIIIVGESYFDREFLKILIKKYKKNDFDFNLILKHANKTAVLKDFEKYKNYAINSDKNNLNKSIIFSCDLDFDVDCISSFFKKQQIDPNEFSENFIMTIQVREIESWILSDPIGLESWTKIPKINFEKCLKNFDISQKSTEVFLNIVSQKSLKFKELLCNSTNITKKSEYYNEELMDFIIKYFDPERARKNNKSLDRFIEKIINIV